MPDDILKRDQNRQVVLAGVTDDSNAFIKMLPIDPSTGRLKVSAVISSGIGTVTTVSVATANGFAGSVATASTSPVITLSTTVVGIVYGDGTALVPALTTGTGTTVALQTNAILITPTLGVASATNLAITGTAGAGFVTLVSQSSNPTAPPSGTLLLHSSTVAGFTRMEQDNEATTNLVLGRDTVFIASNTSGSTILKGRVVYISGQSGSVPNVDLAKANSSTTMPTIGLAMDDISNNSFGQIMQVGVLKGFNTAALTVGSQLFVSPNTAGISTAVRPSGTTNIVQRIGSVLVSDTTNGSLFIDVAPALLNTETGTNSPTWTGTAIIGTTINATTGFEINGGATLNTILKGNGTNYIASIETYPTPSTSGNVLTSDGTNWLSSAVAVTLNNSVTLTNKRNTPRVVSFTSTSTPTIDYSSMDMLVITSLAVNTTFQAPLGTPVQGEKMMVRLIDSGTARSISFNGSFRAGTDVALPTTTVQGKVMYLGFVFNATDSRVDLVALTNNI